MYFVVTQTLWLSLCYSVIQMDGRSKWFLSVAEGHTANDVLFVTLCTVLSHCLTIIVLQVFLS